MNTITGAFKLFGQITYQRSSYNLRTKLIQSNYKLLSNTPDYQLTFQWSNGTKKTVQAKEGETLLDVVLDKNVDIDGFGACEGTLACSSCHLIFPKEIFDRLNDKITDEELDMLDLAAGLTPTSRLGCQIHVSKILDGAVIQIPEDVLDARG